ncbi:MAG: addiction module antitoxin [Acidobacteria bacterium]|nr:addiction module antitoxin [Acidobacteriota bacterium]
MQKKLTITVSEEVYRGLQRKIGRGRISRFLEDLARPHVVDRKLEAAYREMSREERREAEALEWAEGTLSEVQDDPR